MKRFTNLCLVLMLTPSALLGVSAGSAGQRGPQRGSPVGVLVLPASSPGNLAQTDGSIATFWQKFKAAVIKGDKAAVAALSQFPIDMPYGIPAVRTKAQLIRRYRDVFNHDSSAAKCFATAQPATDPARPKEFTVACKNSAGDEVVIYSFKRVGKGWAFNGLDNLNE